MKALRLEGLSLIGGEQVICQSTTVLFKQSINLLQRASTCNDSPYRHLYWHQDRLPRYHCSSNLPPKSRDAFR
ncbi:uncharacterized protein EI97DRAFT_33461 [Westerdykella ornata]|uniref:Uncharacterized protein n=1 Tax=Westerdykella ornata TaxID=318751 RepID=A0A6A6JY75_WESOR|nr:uncharacterized protein EI97DRAFT_33461 [Westerdykella ornata]KAF2281570.1 hypothetical protein EI97DRAFT_33461 [Westerdykella ornata]